MKIKKKPYFVLLSAFFVVSFFWLSHDNAAAADRAIPGTGIIITPDGIKMSQEQVQKEKQEAEKEAAEEEEEEAEASPVKAKKAPKAKKKEKQQHITTICPPGTKAKVVVGEDADVGNVTTICEKGGEAEVSIGSETVEKGAEKGKIEKHVKAKNVTTTAKEGGKAAVNVGSVSIGK